MKVLKTIGIIALVVLVLNVTVGILRVILGATGGIATPGILFLAIGLWLIVRNARRDTSQYTQLHQTNRNRRY